MINRAAPRAWKGRLAGYEEDTGLVLKVESSGTQQKMRRREEGEKVK